MHFLNENELILPRISLKFVPEVGINNIPALVQTMAWPQSGGKPLSESMILSLLTPICVTLLQWVKRAWCFTTDKWYKTWLPWTKIFMIMSVVICQWFPKAKKSWVKIIRELANEWLKKIIIHSKLYSWLFLTFSYFVWNTQKIMKTAFDLSFCHCCL